ncbi:MAG: PA0069 family radical SAM protein [Ignavibacteriaceae bacterium]|nr:PA0069 family radical SAM protein [Ignavibacteriaceae bacterium]
MKKRGTTDNLHNRFNLRRYELPAPDEFDIPADEMISPVTELLIDNSKSIISTNDSEDIPFTYSVNPYRGCEHGCIYCYARPSHEYLGFSLGLDFETKITFKPEADKLLEKELTRKNYKPDIINFSGNTDCYQPAERYLKLTRKCLQVAARFNNPFVIITKSSLVRRDIDIISDSASGHLAAVGITLSTLDPALASILEPRAASPSARLRTIELLSSAGVPVSIITSPVIPGLTDHEIPAILKAGKEAGAKNASYAVLRLPYGVKELFVNWLIKNLPAKAEKVINRIRELRDGKLNDSETFTRMRGRGELADTINNFFKLNAKKLGLDSSAPELRTDLFIRGGQIKLDF